MKAIVFTEYGSPDRLRLGDVPKPVPRDDEVLVRVRASSINAWDWEFLSGTTLINRLFYGLVRPKPAKRVLGADIAGTIEAVGSAVTRFQPGDDVYGDLSDRWGGFAEYACAPENSLERKPANLSFADAAAVPQAGVLAWQGLRCGRPVGPGQAVLINGAGGGVGTFAVQLAHRAGADVTGVDAGHKLDAVRACGADHVIDFAAADFTRTGRHYDLIVDVHGHRAMSEYKRALAPTGTYAMVGGRLPRILQALVMGLWGMVTHEGRRIRVVAAGPNKGLAELTALLEAGEITPVVDGRYPLDEVPAAFRHFVEGLHKGKVVITIAS